jgi:hypothetical protein
MADKKEMTAVEYLKEKMRLTDGCAIDCRVCRLSNYNNGKLTDCEAFQLEYPEEAVAIVQEWAEEQPAKTILDDFFEKFPNAPTTAFGYPIICPHHVGYSENEDWCEDERCLDCWSRPLEG